MPDLRVVATEDLTAEELHDLRGMLEGAFAGAFEGGLTDQDWDHTLGGIHLLLLDHGLISHAAVVPRVLMADDSPIRTGYVEGVATSREHRHRGHASEVMRETAKIIHACYELGALATGVPDFYMRLGWELWRGPTGVDSPGGRQWTPDEDGAVMILRTPATADLDAAGPLICDWREGDVW